MILIADSGSTKCDWVLVNGNENREFSTKGLNPFFYNSEQVKNELLSSDLSTNRMAVSEVYFYGASCHNDLTKNIIKVGLEQVFVNAKIFVEHDLAGAVYATCGNDPGITCILGTGSNSCYFDGKSIYEEVPSLGYLLGDEGSACYFGKKLLTDFLYKRLPQSLNDELKINQGLTKDIIFENVYQKPHCNVYMASFTKNLSNFIEEEYVENLLLNGFNQFTNIHIKCFPKYKEVPVHFIGSVALHFQTFLQKVLLENEISLGIITSRPIDNLVRYHNK